MEKNLEFQKKSVAIAGGYLASKYPEMSPIFEDLSEDALFNIVLRSVLSDDVWFIKVGYNFEGFPCEVAHQDDLILKAMDDFLLENDLNVTVRYDNLDLAIYKENGAAAIKHHINALDESLSESAVRKQDENVLKTLENKISQKSNEKLSNKDFDELNSTLKEKKLNRLSEENVAEKKNTYANPKVDPVKNAMIGENNHDDDRDRKEAVKEKTI